MCCATGGGPRKSQPSQPQNKENKAPTLAEEMMIDSEAVMANFDFLSSEGEVDDDDHNNSGSDHQDSGVDKETEDVLNEFNFLSNQQQQQQQAGENTPDKTDSKGKDANALFISFNE